MKIIQAATLLLLAASTAALPQVVRAEQTANVAAEDAATTRTFTLRNISKERMLFWLQPSDAEKGAISPPAGVTELKTDDATNALIVRGSGAALDELQKVIGLLDQPLQVVELDVYMVFARRGELQKLQQGAEPPVLDGIVNLDYPTRDAMDALMLSPGAYVMSGKILTFNNVAATVPLQKVELTDVKPAKNAPLPPTQIALTPMVNRDGTVTIAANIINNESFEISTFTNVKNNDTVRIGARVGGNGKFSDALEAAGAPRDAELVVVITPHVLQKTVAPEDK